MNSAKIGHPSSRGQRPRDKLIQYVLLAIIVHRIDTAQLILSQDNHLTVKHHQLPNIFFIQSLEVA
jgi:hypothetical protein